MIDVFSGSGARPAGDILSRVVRVTLGGQEYVLPVRSIKANRDWKDALNARTAAFLSGLNATGDDYAAIFARLETQIEDLLDMLVAYDTTGVLPTRDEIEAIEPDASLEVVVACREVWRAASPLVDISLTTVAEILTGPENGSSPPTNTPARPTASGRRKRSTTA